ncbi:MAG: hypothetical protein E7557_03495 [Ruminococcaceae bacterium]|nr:hypothetical protein [Oscillospiraceae bacterium]
MALIFSGIAYGILEIFLLNLLLKNVLKGNMTSSVIFLFIKLISYAVALALIYFFFLDSVKYLAIGYTVGVIISIPFILLLSKKNNNIIKSNEGDDNK